VSLPDGVDGLDVAEVETLGDLVSPHEELRRH